MKIAINNGHLIDPKNNISEKLNISIENGKIVELSKKILTGDKVIDANNLYVTPGFIDMHMHEDKILDGTIKINIFEKLLKMGVTSAIGGNCGIGIENISEYLNLVDLGFPINYGTLLPHEILRKHIDIHDRYANLENKNIEKMYHFGKNLIKESGLLGISFGIEYIPGIDFNELITLSRLGKNRVVSAHLREDGENVLKSLKELLEIGKFSDTHLQISHIGSMAGYGQMNKFLNEIENKKEHGTKLMCDCYPYKAFSTLIGSSVFDNNYIENHNFSYEQLQIVSGPLKGNLCTKEIFEQLRKTAPETLVVGHMMIEKDIDTAILNKNTVIVSDGILTESGEGHPRAAGTFPKFLKEYVKEKKLLSIEEAIEKITFSPAKILEINKGSLEIGADADITIFSLDEIEDQATFENTTLPPKGIKYVIINGKLSLIDNEVVNFNSGKSIRKFL